MTVSFACRDATVVRGRRRLVDAIGLEVCAGELVALMGENGAGKSTLLRVLSGEIVPDQGEASFGGRALREWRSKDLARCRAVLPQDSHVAFPFTALEIALLGRSPHDGGYPGAHDRRIARECLRRVDAGHLEDRLFPTLSGGERGRVMLARALAQLAEPAQPCRGLLLDEPVAALDVAHQHLALQVAQDAARREGMGVVAVLHDLNLAARYADRVALMKDGRLLCEGPPAAVMTEARLADCFRLPILRIEHPACGHPLLVAAP